MSGGDPFRNIGQYMATEAWTLETPLRPGMQVVRREGLVGRQRPGEQQIRRWCRCVPDVSPHLLCDGDRASSSRPLTGRISMQNGIDLTAAEPMTEADLQRNYSR